MQSILFRKNVINQMNGQRGRRVWARVTSVRANQIELVSSKFEDFYCGRDEDCRSGGSVCVCPAETGIGCVSESSSGCTPLHSASFASQRARLTRSARTSTPYLMLAERKLVESLHIRVNGFLQFSARPLRSSAAPQSASNFFY